MEIHIRNAMITEYEAVEALMKQVHQLHVEWRPDIYKDTDTVLPFEIYEQAVRDKTFFVAEYGGQRAGILCIVYRHIESSNQVTRNVIFVDSMAVNEKYRGKGIGHSFFDFLKKLKDQGGYDGIELQVNARNKRAYSMYADYGFTDKSINMEFL